MRQLPLKLAKALLITLMASILLIGQPASAAAVDESALKAAFLKNFLGFVHWSDSQSPLTLCIQGDRSLYQTLHNSQAHLELKQSVQLHWVELPATISHCQALYLSDMDLGEQKRMLGALKNSPILTMSDLPEFAKLGGMVGLVRDNNRLRFEVNYISVFSSGLEIESRLLRLASWVYTNTQMAAQ